MITRIGIVTHPSPHTVNIFCVCGENAYNSTIGRLGDRHLLTVTCTVTTASLVGMWVGKAIIKSSTITTILFNFIFPPKLNQYLRRFTQHARKYITILIIHLLTSILSSKTSEFLELPPSPDILLQ